MIEVSVDENRDVALHCKVCDEYVIVQKCYADSPFWPEYVGEAVLTLLGKHEA